MPCWVPGKSHVRTKVVRVGRRLAEDQSNRRVIRNCVQGLLAFVARYSGPFIPQSKVERKPRRDLPIVLYEPVDGGVVVRRACCSRAAQRSIPAVGYEVIDKCVERGIVPFATRPRQRGCLRDVVPPFDSKLERVLSPNITYVLHSLVDVLHISLRSEAEGSEVAAEWINFHVREIRKLGGRQTVWPAQP